MTPYLSRARAVALATRIVLPSLPLLLIAACAASDQMDAPPDTDDRVVIPAPEAGDEPSFDAAVGVDAPAVPCAVGNLCSVPTPLTLGSIAAIGGRSKSDVWASATNGLVMHWSGQQWTALESNINETLSSIFLTPDEVWGVAGTLVLRRALDPNTVRTVRASFTGDLFRSAAGIAVLSHEDVYVGVAPGYNNSNGRYLANLNFATGQVVYPPPSVHPVTNESQLGMSTRAIYLVPNKMLWLVGDRAVVAGYPVAPAGDGGGSSLGQGVVVPVQSQVNLLAAWGHDEHLWAAGENGTILHFDGSDWHTENTGTVSTIHAIFGVSPKDIWAAGDQGTVLHYDGDAWSSVDVRGYGGSLRAVWASAPDDVWIGGEGGLLHWGALP